MKKITLLFTVAFLSYSLFADVIRKDTLISDFEDYSEPNPGVLTYYVTSTNCTKSVVDLGTGGNPASDAVNQSTKALKVVGTSAFQNWEGLYTARRIDGGSSNSLPIHVNSNPAIGYRYFHMMIYRQEEAKILIVAKGMAPNNTEYYSPEVITGQPEYVNKWDTVTVDLLGGGTIQDGITYHRYNFNLKRNSGAFTMWIDNVYFSNSRYWNGGPLFGGPTTAMKEQEMKERIIVSRYDQNTVRVEMPKSDGHSNVNIYNIHGQLLKTMNNIGSELIELKLPENNLYILQCSNKNGIQSIKF